MIGLLVMGLTRVCQRRWRGGREPDGDTGEPPQEPRAAEARPLLQGVAARRFLLHRGGRRAQDPAHARRPRERARADPARRAVDERPGLRAVRGSARPTCCTRARRKSRYWLYRDGVSRRRVELSPRPAWYDASTATGKPMTRIGTLQGTYLGIYQAKVCEYWTEKPQKVNCKFCSVGLNLGIDDADEKSVDEVLEVVRAARRESGITYVDFNTGHYEGDTYLDILEPYILRIKEELGPPGRRPDAAAPRPQALRPSAGDRRQPGLVLLRDLRPRPVRGDLSRASTPSTGSTSTSRRSATARRSTGKGPSDEPWVTNGEIIAGLEPPGSSIRAIDWITSVGAIPDRLRLPAAGRHRPRGPRAAADRGPGPGLPPPLRGVHGEGPADRLAPNIHVSLVLLPEECRFFSTRRFPWRTLKLKAMPRPSAISSTGARRPCLPDPGPRWGLE